MTALSIDLDVEMFTDLAESVDGPTVVRLSATLPVETTPLEAYAALTGKATDDPTPYAFLLESAEKTASSDPDGAFRPTSASADRHARYSYVGYDPEAVVTVDSEETTITALRDRAPVEAMTSDGAGDVLDTCRAALPAATVANPAPHDRQRLEGGLVGFLAYDAVYDLWLEEVGHERPSSRFPDAEFVLTTRTLAFDEFEGTITLLCTPFLQETDDPGAVYDALVAEAERVTAILETAPAVEPGTFVKSDGVAGPRQAYEAAVERAKEHVLDGDIYQGVISRSRQLAGTIDPIALYAALRAVNPSPYMYLLEHDDRTVVGASPETLVSVRGDTVTANPIAGTCRRGSSPVDDRRLAGEMLADPKERAEHTMLVDLARNDVRRVATPGSVRVEEFMNVLKYSHVQHIESTVTGQLAADADAFDATRAAFPAGTLSGAPKVRAMEIINDLEATPRGLYGGGVGYFSWSGDADMAIVIRTATIESGAAEGLQTDLGRYGGPDVSTDQQLVTVRAGAGIVADSDPAAEYEETEAKMDGVLTALEEIQCPGGHAMSATLTPGAAGQTEPRVVFVDNYDSFTYNLVEYVSEHAGTAVVKNTATLEEIESLEPDALIISPGPGHPAHERDVGVTTRVLETLSPTIPTLGVCLGLEAAVYTFGGEVDRAPAPIHGKASPIEHDSKGVFTGLDQNFQAGRYHSLIATAVPDCFAVTARTADEDSLVMGIRHREYPLSCVQFHPESVLTAVGHDLLENFLAQLDG